MSRLLEVLDPSGGRPAFPPPVWAMRQVGRWDPEYQKLRAGRGFFEFTRDPHAVAKASLLPLRFGVDALILFYDLTTLPTAMGLPFRMAVGEGPVPVKPIREEADVAALAHVPDPAAMRPLVEALRTVRGEVGDELPVIAFAGAPFTTASYCLGTGKDVEAARVFARENPAAFEGLLGGLEAGTIAFLRLLAANGVDALQLFDTWAGELTVAEYDRWCQPYHRRIFEALRETPTLLFVRECPHVEAMAASGADAISLGTSHDLAAIARRYPHVAVQGNVDHRLLAGGTPEQVAEATRRCVEAGRGFRHIVNLSHGMLPDAKPECFEAFVRTVKGA
ncbi:MAG: hypothetical protein L0216_07210 [Planctomycetales bacterium]|nr:hypothetical protein [Planctomycetales bacterium]